MNKEQNLEDKDKALHIADVMPRCCNCKFWKRESHHSIQFDYGVCTGIDIDIEINGGWSGGVVKSIETDENFYCASFNEA